jgi:hypothetical protein
VKLAGKKASSTSNERAHSVVARIMSRFRSSMKATTLQELTLAHNYARLAAMLIKELDAESMDIGELEALLDGHFGEMKDPVLPAVADEMEEWCVSRPKLTLPAPTLYLISSPHPPLLVSQKWVIAL